MVITNRVSRSAFGYSEKKSRIIGRAGATVAPAITVREEIRSSVALSRFIGQDFENKKKGRTPGALPFYFIIIKDLYQ
jgi:hypothetical protein